MLFTKKRPRPKQKLSPIQENRYFKIVISLVVLALLWVILSPGSGLLAVWRKRSEQKTLQQQNIQLEEENSRLQKEIDKLQNDPGYLEEIARREHNLLKKNERVFEFAPKKSAKEK
ncbi:MAG: septum formation initiator family protein [Proteobacteria bacterium]|nr:septum formation initiator family protein [Pseudomonadota bacterium]